MGIGARIKTLRTKRKKTLKDISALCGVSVSYLSDIENERKSPSLETLEKIAEALEVSQDRLTGQSVQAVIEDKLEELKMTIEDLVDRTKISVEYFKGLDNLIPGGYDYDIMDVVAEALNMRPGELRAALARQEPPAYDGPVSSVQEDFDAVPEEEYTEDSIQRVSKNMTPDQISAIDKIMGLQPTQGDFVVALARFLKQTGKDPDNTIDFSNIPEEKLKIVESIIEQLVKIIK